MDTKKWSFPVLKAARWGIPVLDDEGKTATFEDWMLWVKASDLPLDLPLDPNARYPDITRRIPQAIARTFTQQPAEFVKRNTGLCMVARSCQVKDGIATLQLMIVSEDEERDQGKRGDGILNGGHTYAVVKDGLARLQKGELDSGATNPGDAVIRVEVQTGVAENDLPEISRARNVGVPIEEYSLKNLGTTWQPLKRVLPSEMRARVKFMEGDPEAPDADFDVGDLVKLLALFNNKLYPIGKKDPIIAYTSEKQLITKWEGRDFEHLVPHLAQFIQLHDEVTLMYPKVMQKPGKVNGIISYKREERFTLLSGKPSTYYIPPPFTYPVLAALRAFLSEDGSQWFVPPEKLVKDDKYIRYLVTECWEEYRRSGRNSASFFGRNRQMWKVLSLMMVVRRQEN